MKARVIETGEIIDVKYWCGATYAVFDCNSKIKEIYNEDELEFEPGPKMVSLDKICEYFENLGYTNFFIEDLRKEFE